MGDKSRSIASRDGKESWAYQNCTKSFNDSKTYMVECEKYFQYVIPSVQTFQKLRIPFWLQGLIFIGFAWTVKHLQWKMCNVTWI